LRLFAFNVGVELVDLANFDPGHPDVGTKVLTPYFFYVIEHPCGPVIFDTGAHPRHIGTYHPDMGTEHDGPRIFMAPGEDAVGRLASLGIDAADVRHVVLSHLHIDHAGGVEFFPNAEFHVQRRELRAAHWPAVYQRPFYVRRDFDFPYNWHELDGEHDLFADGRMVLFPTPGHSEGHQSMLVRLDGCSLILVADAAYSPRSLQERRLPGILFNPDEMVASWERLERLRDAEGAQLIFTHDLDWKTKTRLGPEEWYE
jgi:glyoxylase-like metal-dependent hydrolase (beta-lactamase superfamily II)